MESSEEQSRNERFEAKKTNALKSMKRKMLFLYILLGGSLVLMVLRFLGVWEDFDSLSYISEKIFGG